MVETKGNNRIKDMLKLTKYRELFEKPIINYSPIEKFLYVVIHAFNYLSISDAVTVLLDALENHGSVESSIIEQEYGLEKLLETETKPAAFVKTMAILSLRESYRNGMSEQDLNEFSQLTTMITAMTEIPELSEQENKTIRHFNGYGAHVITEKRPGRFVYIQGKH